MKKLMITLVSACAAAFATCAYGEGNTISGTSFEGLAEGAQLNAAAADPEDTTHNFWVQNPADSNDTGVVTAYDTENPAYSYTSTERADIFSGNNEKFLALETSTRILRAVNPVDVTDPNNFVADDLYDLADGDLFADTLVKFTASEDCPALTDDDKIAVWYQEVEDDSETDANEGKTNLVVTAGFLENGTMTTNNFNIALENPIDTAKWYRLTIRAIQGVATKGGTSFTGFYVYLDGNLLAVKENEYSIGLSASDLTPAAQKKFAARQLFLSAVSTGNDTDKEVAGLALAGTGSIDDISFTSYAPNFAVEDILFNLKWSEGIESITLSDNENPLVAPDTTVAGEKLYELNPGASDHPISFTVTTATGYSIESVKAGAEELTAVTENQYSFTIPARTTSIQIDVSAYIPLYKVGDKTFGSFDKALGAAGEGGTIALCSDVTIPSTEGGEDYAGSIVIGQDQDVILDLAGHTLTGLGENATVINNAGTLLITNSTEIVGSILPSENNEEGDVLSVGVESAGTIVAAGNIAGGVTVAKIDEDEFAPFAIEGGNFADADATEDPNDFYLFAFVDDEAYDITAITEPFTGYAVTEKFPGFIITFDANLDGIDNPAPIKCSWAEYPVAAYLNIENLPVLEDTDDYAFCGWSWTDGAEVINIWGDEYDPQSPNYAGGFEINWDDTLTAVWKSTTEPEQKAFDVIIGSVTNGYDTFADALAAANAAETPATLKLNQDVVTPSYNVVAKNMTLDLNGNRISCGPSNTRGVFVVNNGATLTVDDTSAGKNGVIDGSANTYAAVALTNADAKDNTKTAGVVVKAGTLQGLYYGIVGNGSVGRENTSIVIDGGVVKGTAENDCAGIYNPQGNSTIVVNGGTIEGAVGIYAKAGTIIVNGGEVKAVGAFVETPTFNGDGFNPCGDAIVLDSAAGYAGNVSLTLGDDATLASANGFAVREAVTKGANTTLAITDNGADVSGASKGGLKVSDEFADKLASNDATITGYTIAIDGVCGNDSLLDAIGKVTDGGTITLLADVPNATGITIDSKKTFTVDFNGFTYTLNKPGAGSTGTKTCGFQILEGQTVTFKNGTITAAAENKDATWDKDSTSKGIAMFIQNYANLTLDNMVIDGANIAHNGAATRYVMSNNSGAVVIDDTTITAADGDFAFDTCKYAKYVEPTVEVKGNSAITGKVELSGGDLNLVGGTLTGELVATAVGESTVTKGADFTVTAPEGYKWDDNGKLVAKDYTAVVIAGDPAVETKYESFADAFTAAPAGATVKLLADASLGTASAQYELTKNLTLDLNGKTLTMTSRYGRLQVVDATLTVDGTTVGSAFNGTLYVAKSNKGGNLIVNGGTYTAPDHAEAGLAAVQSNGSATEVNVTLKDATFVGGNGSASPRTVDQESIALYFGGAGNYVLENVTATGDTAVYVKAGEVAATNCTFTAYGAAHAVAEEHNGALPTGDAIVLDTTTGYKGGISIELAGADTEVTSANGVAIREAVVGNADASATVGIAVAADVPADKIGDVVISDKFAAAVDTGAATITGYTIAIDGVCGNDSLLAAIGKVADGGTITLLANVTDATGISIDSKKTFTVDFNGFTYTVNKPGAGSTGTATQAFQLLKRQTITFKNGTINAAADNLVEAVLPAKNIKRFFQSYANLTLENMTLDGANLYLNPSENAVCEFANGTVALTGSTSIDAPENCIAVSVDNWKKAYPDGVAVTINTTGTIDGVKVWTEGEGASTPASLTLTAGTITSLDVAGEDTDFTVTKTGATVTAPEGYKWDETTGELVKDVPPPVAIIIASDGTEKKGYNSFADAVKDLADGDSIKLMADAEYAFGAGTAISVIRNGYNLNATCGVGYGVSATTDGDVTTFAATDLSTVSAVDGDYWWNTAKTRASLGFSKDQSGCDPYWMNLSENGGYLLFDALGGGAPSADTPIVLFKASDLNGAIGKLQVADYAAALGNGTSVCQSTDFGDSYNIQWKGAAVSEVLGIGLFGNNNDGTHDKLATVEVGEWSAANKGEWVKGENSKFITLTDPNGLLGSNWSTLKIDGIDFNNAGTYLYSNAMNPGAAQNKIIRWSPVFGEEEQLVGFAVSAVWTAPTRIERIMTQATYTIGGKDIVYLTNRTSSKNDCTDVYALDTTTGAFYALARPTDDKWATAVKLTTTTTVPYMTVVCNAGEVYVYELAADGLSATKLVASFTKPEVWAKFAAYGACNGFSTLNNFEVSPDGKYAYAASYGGNSDSTSVRFIVLGDYVVDYDLGGATYGDTLQSEFTATDIASGYVLPELEKDGYDFTGWKVDGKGDAIETLTAATFGGEKGGLNLVATFEEIKNFEVILAGETTGEKFATIEAALEAAEEGATIKLLDDVEVPADFVVNKNITLDLNGKVCTVSTATINGNLTVIDSIDPAAGQMVVSGAIAVAGKLDVSALGYGKAGLVSGQAGSLAIAAGGEVVFMSVWDAVPINYLKANSGSFIDPVPGAKATVGGKTYAWNGEMFLADDAVVTTQVTYGGKTFTEGFAIDQITLALAAMEAGDTHTVFLKDVDLVSQVGYSFPADTTIDFKKPVEQSSAVMDVVVPAGKTLVDGVGVAAKKIMNVKGDMMVAGNVYHGGEKGNTELNVNGTLTVADALTVGGTDPDRDLANGIAILAATNLTVVSGKKITLVPDAAIVRSGNKLEKTVFADVDGYEIQETDKTGYYEYALVQASTGPTWDDETEIVIGENGVIEDANTSKAFSLPVDWTVATEDDITVIKDAEGKVWGKFPAYYAAAVGEDGKVTISLSEAANLIVQSASDVAEMADGKTEIFAVGESEVGLAVKNTYKGLYYGLATCSTVNGDYAAPAADKVETVTEDGQLIRLEAPKSGAACFYKMWVSDVAPEAE